jgi:hypothetical protein
MRSMKKETFAKMEKNVRQATAAKEAARATVALLVICLYQEAQDATDVVDSNALVPLDTREAAITKRDNSNKAAPIISRAKDTPCIDEGMAARLATWASQNLALPPRMSPQREMRPQKEIKEGRRGSTRRKVTKVSKAKEARKNMERSITIRKHKKHK